MELKDNFKTFEMELEELNKIIYKQNEREKKMAQVGSIEQISQVSRNKLDEINNLINEYLQRSAEILVRKDSGEFKPYTPEYVQNLVKQETEAHLAKYETKVDAFLKDSLSWLSIGLNKKEEIRFPFRTSTDFQKAQLGEMKSMRAQTFLNSVENPNIILSELLSAYRSNDEDYFNSLVNYILMEEPEDEKEKFDLLEDRPERVKLYTDVRKLYKDFADKNNLTVLDIAVQTLLVVSTEATQFLAAIKDKSIYFMPKRMAEKMDQNEVARNIEAVNGSTPYWETKLESLKFVHQIV